MILCGSLHSKVSQKNNFTSLGFSPSSQLQPLSKCIVQFSAFKHILSFSVEWQDSVVSPNACFVKATPRSWSLNYQKRILIANQVPHPLPSAIFLGLLLSFQWFLPYHTTISQFISHQKAIILRYRPPIKFSCRRLKERQRRFIKTSSVHEPLVAS